MPALPHFDVTCALWQTTMEGLLDVSATPEWQNLLPELVTPVVLDAAAVTQTSSAGHTGKCRVCMATK